MAAGLGFKTFTTGEVLTAADTNGYLMQGVLVFASAAARDAAITSPQEGQFAYLKDTNVTTYYTGSAWANLDTTGMTNPMTTTGDMVYSSSGSTPARLGIGSTGQVITVAGGIPSWATPASGGGMTVISTGTLSSTGVTFSSISGYNNLQLSISGYNVGGQRLYVRINGDTGSNYTGGYLRQRDGTAYVGQYANSPGQSTYIVADGDVNPDSGATNSVTFYFPDYAATTGAHIIQANAYALSTYKIPSINAWSYTGTAGAITSITIVSSAGTFSAGTYTLYGVK